MTVFFNGRTIVSPGTFSAVDDSALLNQNLSTGNVVCCIGPSTGGQPNTKLAFGNPADATAALISGDLLTAVQNAFDPSNETDGPSQVIAIRVNPAVQAALTLKDGSAANVINLVSTDYGQYTNQIKVTVAAGSISGFKLTTQLGNSIYTQDNVARTPFQIQYIGGQASATMTINGTQLVLDAPGGTPVATALFASYPTVAQLVDYINTIAGFTATVLGGNNDIATANGFDYVAAVDVKTAPYTANANLQAVIDWFNGQGDPLVTATRVANAGTVPAVLAATFLAGGSDGVITNTQWSNAFTTLQGIDAQWIVPASGDQSIVAMADAHVQFMSTVGKKERRAICGTIAGTSDATAITDALAINSDRTSLVHIGYYNYNASGVLTLFPPYLTAALIAGGFAGVGPGTPMTNKTLAVRGLERYLRDPIDTDPLILAGVLCVEQADKGFIVTKSISTWLVNKSFYRVEQSCGNAGDFTARSLRTALDVLRGQKQDPNLLARAQSITQSTCTLLAKPEPLGPGVLVGDATNPPFKNIVASIAGDVLSVSVQASLVIPNNYVLITIAAVPFSGSVTA
jgi:hypothetical protein